MRVGIVIIGDELLSGKRQDKHLPKVIELLAARGMELAWARYLGDDRELLVANFRQTLGCGDLVFSFGGIGATPDDLTRSCIAEAAGLPLVRHPEAVALLERRFGEAAYPHRVRMAELPEGAVLIPNPVNQVPGFSVGHHHFVPGFPNMAWPMVEWVLDTRYRHLFSDAPVVERLIHVTGKPESELIPLLESVLGEVPGIRLASLPSTGDRRHIELGVKGPPQAVEAATRRLAAGLRALGAQWTAPESARD